MAKIAILSPAADTTEHYGRWPEVLARNAEPLLGAGMEVEARDWTAADDLAQFDLVLPLLAWGYPDAHDLWLERVGRWEEEGVRLANPGSVLRWNSRKTYLERLAERGAPVLPTMFVDRAAPVDLEAAARRFGTDELVVKPQVSAGAWRTIRWLPGRPLEGGPEGPAMIQPFLPSIAEAGEVSLLFFGGRFSHAVAKRPQAGDFRVQPEYDGIIVAHRPEPAELEAAGRVLAAIQEDLLYARIDLVRGLDGEPALIEVELIEPDLFLDYSSEAGKAFAGAVAELIAR